MRDKKKKRRLRGEQKEKRGFDTKRRLQEYLMGILHFLCIFSSGVCIIF